MRKMLLAVLVALAILIVAGDPRLPRLASAAAELCVDPALLTCSDVSTFHDNSMGKSFLMAQAHNLFKCLEKCSDGRYSCEKDNKDKKKNRPGTKENWEESSKCQLKYIDCMDNCQ